MNDRELCLFIPAWGQKHLDLLRDFALPSLMLPGNLPALKLEKIYVECFGVEHENADTVRVVSEGLAGLNIEVAQNVMPTRKSGDIIHGLRSVMKLCMQRQTRMLLAMPDSIFGNGSVSNIFNYAKGKPVTVAGAHVRVNEDLWKERCHLWTRWPSNKFFVHAALSIGAVDICDTNKDNVTDVGGIAWTQINQTTKLMLHYLPTSYLCWFTQSDVDWWNAQPSWGSWDHLWPTLLLQGRRLRVIGSSNVFFAIELEDAARSGKLRPSPNTVGQELYNKRQPHNDACGCFLIELESQ